MEVQSSNNQHPIPPSIRPPNPQVN